MKGIALAIGIALLTAGCGSVNNVLVEKRKSVEYYRIFDIKTTADRTTVADAASNGLGRNVESATEARPIPEWSKPPEQSGRFKLVNPFAGSKLAALASSGGNVGFKIATCEGAVWTATAKRSVSNSSDLNLTTCLWQYQGGYHLDTYATFTKVEGGLMELSRSMASAMVGTPEEWTEKTFLDIVRSIAKVTGAQVSYLEGYPALAGTPWLDGLDTF